jgi:hypothetical protein
VKISHDPEDDQTGRRIIDAQLRHPDETVWAQLYSDTYALQTHRILTAIEDATRSSLTHRGEDIAAERARFLRKEITDAHWAQLADDYSEWKKRAIHVLTITGERRRFAADRANRLRGFEWGRDVLGTLRVLAQAVAEHQAASEAAGIEPEPHDRLLWLRLSTLRVTPGMNASRVITLDELADPKRTRSMQLSSAGRRKKRTGRKSPAGT